MYLHDISFLVKKTTEKVEYKKYRLNEKKFHTFLVIRAENYSFLYTMHIDICKTVCYYREY